MVKRKHKKEEKKPTMMGGFANAVVGTLVGLLVGDVIFRAIGHDLRIIEVADNIARFESELAKARKKHKVKKEDRIEIILK